MQKIIIITPEDEIKSADYEDHESIQKVVDGCFEVCGKAIMPLTTGELQVTLFCNDEALLRSDKQFEKLNAVASLICSSENNFIELHGNVAIAVDVDTPTGIDSRGFKYMEEEVGGGEIEEAICEHWCAEYMLLLYINHNEKTIKKLHEDYDNNN